jgi:paraquat-inducible protein A
MAVTGMLLFLPANFYPLMTLRVLGSDTSSSLFSASLSMFEQGQPFVGLIVLLTGFVFPLLTLSLLFWVSAGLFLGWQARWMPDFMRWYQHLSEWAMTDVYLIGVFVTIIKMNHTSEIDFDVGFFCFIGLVMITVAAQTSVDKPLFWKLLEGKEKGHRLQEYKVLFRARTGKEAGLVLCHTCHKTLPAYVLAKQGHKHILCPRCGEIMHQRKQGSISRTWALICTAIILTLPANLLPIMDVEFFGQSSTSTIMDGIIFFFQEGSYGIGLIILTASILVPLFKITGMSLILLSIHFHWATWLKHKSLMFRFIEFIGRWSMLDIFVIALLCALVRFGYITTINAAPAALYFTGVVLCTMFAAISFDPRLLWDTDNWPDMATDGFNNTENDVTATVRASLPGVSLNH